MRFNEDLSLRPAWLPPCGAQPRLAFADWWDRPAGVASGPAAAAPPAQAQQPATEPVGGAGAGAAAAAQRSWWRVTKVAESPTAAGLRAAQVASLRGRQLLPELVAATISGQATAATAGGDHVLGAARQLASMHGVQPDTVQDAVAAAFAAVQAASSHPDAEGGGGSGGSATAQAPLLRLLGLLDVAIFAADDAARRLHGETPSDGDRAETPKAAAACRSEAAQQFPARLEALQVLV